MNIYKQQIGVSFAVFGYLAGIFSAMNSASLYSPSSFKPGLYLLFSLSYLILSAIMVRNCVSAIRNAPLTDLNAPLLGVTAIATYLGTTLFAELFHSIQILGAIGVFLLILYGSTLDPIEKNEKRS